MTSRSVHIGQICQKFEWVDKQMARRFRVSTSFHRLSITQFLPIKDRLWSCSYFNHRPTRSRPMPVQNSYFFYILTSRIHNRLHNSSLTEHTCTYCNIFTKPNRALWVPSLFNITENLSQFRLYWSKTKSSLHKCLVCMPSQR